MTRMQSCASCPPEKTIKKGRKLVINGVMLVSMRRRMIMAAAFVMLVAGIAEAGQYKL